MGDGVGVDKEKAFEWYQEAAVQGNSAAQIDLGIKYHRGEGVEENKEKAFEWFHKAAEQGHSEAQFNVGVMYNNGEGVEANKEKAFMWYHKAAVQGNSVAQFNVGVMYNNGEGVEANKGKAFMWYQKAAELGHHDARRRLSECYQKGIGVAKDLPLATYWLLKSLPSTTDRSTVTSLDHHRELIKLFPSILEKYSELQKINVMKLTSDKIYLGDEDVVAIAEFIRSNSSVTHLEITYPASDISNVQFGAIVEALKFNTQLIHFQFDDWEPSEMMTRIDVLLTQNRNIVALRQYVKDLRIETTPGFPLDIVKLMVDKTIVANIKGGQTKEATKNAIDEILITAGMKPLEEDSKMN